MSNSTPQNSALKQAVQVGKLAMVSSGAAAGQQLATGLGGVIGSDYRPGEQRLVFVEFSAGNLSRLNLIPSASVVSSGTATLPGTYCFDFDTGAVSAAGQPFEPPFDVWWSQQTSTEREMVPGNGAQIVRLGAVGYGALSHPELMALAYGSTPIDGSDASNELASGTVFAVRTSSGNYAKVQVIAHGYDVQLRWTTYQLDPAYEVLGTGYDQPEDVKVAAGEQYAYVTERTGSLLRVELANADRAFATVVASGLAQPHQMALDEAHNRVFVSEYGPAARLVAVDLASGAQTTVFSGLDHPVGLLVTHDQQFAYVGEQGGGTVARIQLGTGHREVLVSGLVSPFFMTWTDPGESGILIAERDPADRITRLNLAEVPVTTSTVIAGAPFRPSSVALVSPTDLLVCCDQEIARYQLASSVYTPTGPMLLGIGHVPLDRIGADGYADTTPDAGYFFQVRDAPFGGTLPVMFNHARAYAEGARYYKLLVDGVEPRQSWTDYRWSTSSNRFVLQAVNPSSSGYYAVRPASELWYHHWLGYMLATPGLSNGAHTVSIRLFAAQNAGSEIGSEADPGHSFTVRIDNSAPLVQINDIWHDGMVVSTCGVVDSGSDEFSFDITAHDSEEHLLGWSLTALWGNNQSATVASDSYAAHAGPTRKWAGENGGMVPAAPWVARVPGDWTSTRCAHTFRLSATARTIDGWSHLHHVSYHKSITLLLP